MEGLAEIERSEGGSAEARTAPVLFVASLVGILVGTLVLVGWIAGLPAMTRLYFTGGAPVKAPSAVGYVAAGLVLFWARRAGAVGGWRYVGMVVAAVLVLVVGLGSLVFPKLDPFSAGPEADLMPLRMSLNTALGLTGLGLAFVLHLVAERRGEGRLTGVLEWASQLSALFAAAIGYVAVIGHFYSAGILYSFSPEVTMALPSAATVLALGFAAVLLRPAGALAAEVTSALVGGKVVRWVVLTGAVLIPAIGAAYVFAQATKWIDFRLGAAMFAASNVALLATGMWISGRRLNQASSLEARAREELSAQAALLDMRVRERTAELEISEKRFRLLAEAAPAMIMMADRGLEFRFVNAMASEFFGSVEAVEGRGWLDRVHPEDRGGVDGKLERAGRSPDHFEFQIRIRRHDGEYRWVHTHGVPRFSVTGGLEGYIWACLDTTEAHRAREALREALENKEEALVRERMLRREIDHRVRNNIASLLGLIAFYESSSRATSAALAITTAIRGKVRAMKEVHDLIARSAAGSVDLAELCTALTNAMVPDEQRGAVCVRPSSRVQLKQNQASALAIILQELITNSYKHGALSTEGGAVELEWEYREVDGGLRMRWAERGGSVRVRTEAGEGGLGLQLIEGLARSDLGGDFAISRDAGSWTCVVTARVR